MVFVYDQQYAVKIPRWHAVQEGLRANLHERWEWQQTHAEHLCPIILSGSFGLFLVMPYARPLTDQEYDALEEDYINEGAIQFGRKLSGDFKRENYGILDDRRVRIDYETYKP